MPTLYDIGAEMQALEDFLESIDGEVTDPQLEKVIDDWLAANEKGLADKIDAYGKVIKNHESDMIIQRIEAARLQQLVASNEAFIAKLKERLKEFFNLKQIKKVEGTLFKFWVQNNGTRGMTLNDQYVGVDEDGNDRAKLLPDCYKKVMVVPATDLIKKDLMEIEALTLKAETAAFNKQDADRLDELLELVGNIAFLNPIGNHIRMK